MRLGGYTTKTTLLGVTAALKTDARDEERRGEKRDSEATITISDTISSDKPNNQRKPQASFRSHMIAETMRVSIPPYDRT